MKAQSDQQVREAVQRQLEWEPQVKSTDIGVAAADGIVALSGFVDNYPEKLAAEKATKRVCGVKAVANNIEVRWYAQHTDPEITRRVVSALETDVVVPQTVTATVKEGIITLEGSVDWKFEQDAAESAVRNLSGVRGVSNRIEVKPHISPTEIKAKITGALREALRREAEVDARLIGVEVHDSTVILTGSVRSWLEKEAAEHTAWCAPGVATVENHIIVSQKCRR